MEAGEGRIVEGERITLDEQQVKVRRQRSVALALALVAFVLIFYIGTMVKLGTQGEAPASGTRGGPAVTQGEVVKDDAARDGGS